MDLSCLKERAKQHLYTLCNKIPNRRVGSEGNRLATSFFTESVRSFGFEVECPEFECIDWKSDGATITVDNHSYAVQASPYSLGTRGKAPLVTASSTAEMEKLSLANKIVLLRGQLTREQFLPKNFPFFQAEEQQHIIQLLEKGKPLAIITATSRNPEMAGALYPFPVFEDGDFDIPSVFITQEQGNELAEHVGDEIFLEIQAERLPAQGSNVVARKGNDRNNRIVLFAHIDAKPGTPGALDNGTGIVTLLLLAELLKNYGGSRCIEIVALNGEDYYSNPGEQLYLKQNEDRFHEIALGINMDGLGYIKGKTAYSLYECSSEMIDSIEKVFSSEDSFCSGESRFQGDHAIFLMNGCPALALTSELVTELMVEYVHTERDTLDIIDPEKLARTALALQQILINL